MARKARKGLLRFAGWLSGSILGTLGVITSGCGWAGTDYGVPSAVNITGTVTSDSQPVQGIQLRMVHNGYPDELDIVTSDGYGHYWLEADLSLFSLPDTVTVELTDIDGPLNGSFLPEDTLLPLERDPDLPDMVYLEVNFELVPDEG